MPVFDKVLLVEDDPITILVCKRTIEIARFANEVKSVINGQEAIDFLKAGEEIPDLILLDLNMPILNGWEFLEWYTGWVSSAPKVPSVYILSSTVDPEDQKKAMEYSCVKGFISKPLTKEHLASLEKEYGSI
ncbi:MAG TPA: response regulator [Chitinophagaceae bacterium]|nr:response regulator [Chitinophagaceae bacterium]